MQSMIQPQPTTSTQITWINPSKSQPTTSTQPIEVTWLTTHNLNPNQNPITNPKPTKSTKIGAWGGEISGESWRMRWQDQWRGLARSTTRTRKWGGEIGDNFLESDLEQGGKGRDREWRREREISLKDER